MKFTIVPKPGVLRRRRKANENSLMKAGYRRDVSRFFSRHISAPLGNLTRDPKTKQLASANVLAISEFSRIRTFAALVFGADKIEGPRPPI